MNNRANVIFGVVLMGIGSLFLLDHLQIVAFGDLVRTYWPLAIVAIGLPQLFDQRSFGSGLWMVTVGAWLQMAKSHFFGITYANGWPILVIACGAWITASAIVDAFSGEQNEAR